MSDYERRLRKAIAGLLAELEKEPDDARLLQKLGELHQKLGEMLRAAEYFLRVAAEYQRDGSFLKTVAVAKQVLKLDPNRFAAHELLAETYQRLGLSSDAVPHLAAVADALSALGDTQRVLRIHEQILELDPSWRPKNMN